jgi:hypothetical protein
MAPPGEDPVIGESVPSDETCTTPFAFRVMAQTGSSTSRTVNIAANGTAQFGDIQSISTFLTAERSLGLYDGGSVARFGYAINGSSAGQAAFLNWHNSNAAPLHIGFGSSMSNQQNHLTIASDGRVDVGDRARFKTNGDVGIGTQNPQTALHIVNTEDQPNEGDLGVQGLLIENNGMRDHDNAIEVRTAHGTVFTVGNHGAVHIGDELNGAIPWDDREYRLWVQGGVRTEKVKVDIASANGWADYVFEDDYELMPIDELEAYIKEHKHLPGVPSSEEVMREGIDVAEMNKILLEKIEELTLRVIELEKEANQQNKL